MQIEGNTLTVEQVTAIIENKKILGPEKDIQEVRNAIEAYHAISDYTYDSLTSFLEAHKKLMNRLVDQPGSFRKSGVGIIKGSRIEHVAPPPENIPHLMNDLFNYLKNDEAPVLIKSCVFHYELEFIHPFMDGNGRMGRLWQTVILMSRYPVFQYLPIETFISKTQRDYYEILAACDNAGHSTAFITYMLQLIQQSLDQVLQSTSPVHMSQEDRLALFLTQQNEPFTRKDYMLMFRFLSSATASRDLKAGLDKGLFSKHGDKNQTIYNPI